MRSVSNTHGTPAAPVSDMPGDEDLGEMNPELVLDSLRAVEPWDDADLAERLRVAEQQADLTRDLLRVKTEAFPMDAIRQLPELTIERAPARPHRPAVRRDRHGWVIRLREGQTRFQDQAAVLRAVKLIADAPVFGPPDERPRRAHQVTRHFAACVLLPTALLSKALSEGATVEAIAQRFGVNPRQVQHRLRDHCFARTPIPAQPSPAHAITQEGQPS